MGSTEKTGGSRWKKGESIVYIDREKRMEGDRSRRVMKM